MTLGRRITIGVLLAIVAVVIGISLAVSVVARSALEQQLDARLRAAATRAPQLLEEAGVEQVPSDERCEEIVVDSTLLGAGVDTIAVSQGSASCVAGGNSAATQAVAKRVGARHARGVRTSTEAGVRAVSRTYRQTSTGERRTVVAAASRAPVEQALDRILLGIAGAALIGTAGALLLSRVVAIRALRPVSELSGAIRHTMATRDLATRVRAPMGGDDLTTVSTSFNELLGVLQQAQEAQRQLVADVSHELRTPLASIRSNLEMLAGFESIPPADRQEMIGEAVAQIDELTVLVGDLVDLARDEAAARQTAVELDVPSLLAQVVVRMRKIAPSHEWHVQEQGQWSVVADPALLARAISNMCTNAAKFAPPGGAVILATAPGEISVADRGPGFPTKDLPYVFDQFWRGDRDASIPGSGLGLAIVRRVADSYGGQAIAANRPDGGALVRLCLPPLQVTGGPGSGSVQERAGSSG